MSKKSYTPRYPAEFRERAVRLLSEQRGSYPSDNAAYRGVASNLGCSPDSLRAWCHQAQKDTGERPGLSTEDKARIKELERENRQLRQAIADSKWVDSTHAGNIRADKGFKAIQLIQ